MSVRPTNGQITAAILHDNWALFWTAVSHLLQPLICPIFRQQNSKLALKKCQQPKKVSWLKKSSLIYFLYSKKRPLQPRQFLYTKVQQFCARVNWIMWTSGLAFPPAAKLFCQSVLGSWLRLCNSANYVGIGFSFFLSWQSFMEFWMSRRYVGSFRKGIFLYFVAFLSFSVFVSKNVKNCPFWNKPPRV